MAVSRAALILKALMVFASVLIAVPTSGTAKAKGSSSKKPPPEPPMTVHLVTSAKDGCEPNCPQWIAAQGRIVAGSLSRFKRALKKIGNRNLPVLIHSGGGLTEQAMAIGRLIRKNGLDVAVAKTMFTPCAPEDKACRKKSGETSLRGLPDKAISICASSCAFILAAGNRRFIYQNAVVGVHRGGAIRTKVQRTYRMIPYRARNGAIKYRKRKVSEKIVSRRQTETPDRFIRKYKRYFDQMGIGRKVMNLLVDTPNETIHWLTADELRSTRMVTHLMSTELLLHGADPDNFRFDPVPPPMPIASPLRKPEADCLPTGSNCPLGVESSALSARSQASPAPIMENPPLSPEAARECTSKGIGCPWDFMPTGPQ